MQVHNKTVSVHLICKVLLGHFLDLSLELLHGHIVDNFGDESWLR